jgi:predicted DNA-binding transcriptional regulator YafY
LVRLLNAIDEARYSFEELKDRIADGKAPGTRSLRRYLALLSEAGFPWYFDRASGTYRFADGYSLRRLNLTQRELLASYIDETTTKLLASSDRRSMQAVDASSFAIRLDAVALTTEVEHVFELLQQAERAHRRLTFAYVDKRGAGTSRRVDPYGFIVSSGRIYLVGFDHTRNDMRVFAVDNIADPQIGPQTFERPVDFNLDAYGANSVSGVWHADTLTDVTVRFSPVVAKAAAAANVAREKRLARRDDGGVDITYRVGDPLEIVRWSLGWGAEAEVVAPESARSSAREIAQRIAARYG